MRLDQYLEMLPREIRREFARALGKHQNYVRALASGAVARGKVRQPSPQLAIEIERVSCGLVQRWELRPDLFERPAHAAPWNPPGSLDSATTDPLSPSPKKSKAPRLRRASGTAVAA